MASSNKEKIDLYVYRDFSESLNVGIKFYTRHLKVLSKTILRYAIPPAVLGGALFGKFYSSIFSNPENVDVLFKDATELLSIGVGFILIILGALLSITITFSLFIVQQEEEEVTSEAIWDEARQHFWMIFGTSIVAGIAQTIAFMLLIIPGLYLMIPIQMVFIIRMQERLGVVDAIKKSTKLISGYWWGTLGLIFVSSLLIGIIGYIFQIPAMILMFVGVFAEQSGASSGLFGGIFVGIAMAIQIGGQLFLRTFQYVIIGIRYYSLSEQYEGHGSKSQLKNIGTNNDYRQDYGKDEGEY